jgi:hypothetical protein
MHISFYFILLCLGGTTALGFSRAVSRVLQLGRHEAFALEYLDTYRRYLDSRGDDRNAYGKLIFDSGRMQSIMGGYARMDYRPAFANYRITNHPIILNFIPEIRRKFDSMKDAFGMGHIEQEGARWLVHATDEAIVRYLGALQRMRQDAGRALLNPLEWLRLGIERILAAPFYLLSGLGLIRGFRAVAAENSVAVRYLSGLIALIGLVASLVQIFGGMPAAMAWIRHPHL